MRHSIRKLVPVRKPRPSTAGRWAAAIVSTVLVVGVVGSPAPANAAANPNPARISEASWWLMQELLKLQSGSQNGGIYANKSGYHNTRAANDPNNYSVRDTEDKGGPSDKAAAYDWTFPEAQSFALAPGEVNAELDLPHPTTANAAAANYGNIARFSNRLLAAGKDSRDPRMNGWREFYGQVDNDRDVEGWDFRYDDAVSSDSSHLWHIHLSEDRDKVTSFENKEALLSVLRGETVEQWLNRNAPVMYALTGDWDGNGTMTPAVVLRSGSVWHWHLKNSVAGGTSDVDFKYGDADMVPLAGDWDGNGTFTPAVVDNFQNVRRWHLRNSNTTGVADLYFDYGDKNTLPVTGDWDGNGTFTPGIVVNESGARRWHLRNSNTTGVGEITFKYGNANALPVPGDWDGNGTWTPGIVADDPTGGGTGT
ncbi:hypothetical protein GCM10027615_61370 [Plantactinospora veratri]